jgi:hypothetical protein
MSKFKKEFELVLTEPLTYQCPTGEKKTDKLLFKAPSNSHANILGKMRKELVKFVFQSSLKNPSKPETQKKDKQNESLAELDAPTILFILYGSEFDLTLYTDLFWELILDNICFVTKDIPLTSSLLNNIYYEDRDLILGEYTANFIVPLWMKRQLQT